METLISEINKLKKEKNAIILSHYYERDEVQEVADYVGDSYYLSKIGKNSKENTIVFCGVKFMAESAKILSPEKMILLPVLEALCPMADMAKPEDLIELKKKHKDAKVVCYINSNAEVKALSDVCCTSSNAVKIIKSIEEKDIIFLPDKNLGQYVASKVPEKNIILWNGFCNTHKKVTADYIKKSKEIHKEALVLVHPECEEEVRAMADFIGSTLEIINFATSSLKDEFIIVTEEGVLKELKRNNPHKKFYMPFGGMTCVNMKKTKLQDVYESLKEEKFQIEIEEDIRIKAAKSLEMMHKLGG